MASWFFLFFAILNHINIPITNFEVRIRWSFFPSELPLPTWVKHSRFYIHGQWRIVQDKNLLFIIGRINPLPLFTRPGKESQTTLSVSVLTYATFSMVNCALYTGRWISKAQSQIETPYKYTSKEIEIEKNCFKLDSKCLGILWSHFLQAKKPLNLLHFLGLFYLFFT